MSNASSKLKNSKSNFSDKSLLTEDKFLDGGQDFAEERRKLVEY
jgi:hypothetical protein